jgi:hypothetical protein
MKKTLVCSALAALAIAGTTPVASAGEFETYDKLAFLTFNAPVQVPGTTLFAGTYRFRLADPSSERKVLQVLSHDGGIVYTMFFTREDYRDNVTASPTVTLIETPAGVAPAVKSLFYGGDHYGYEFVYPPGEPRMTPQVIQPEITYSSTAATATAAIPPAPPEPVAEPEPIAEAEPAVLTGEPVAAQTPTHAELAKTATTLPLTAAGGATLLLLAAGIALLRKASH